MEGVLGHLGKNKGGWGRGPTEHQSEEGMEREARGSGLWKSLDVA
jgi:hypothetical protein